MSNTFYENMSDLRAGASNWRFALRWAWIEVKQKYRRSVLGNLWITMNLGILIAGLGILFSFVLNQPIEEFLPYVATGLVAWNAIASAINESTDTFSSETNRLLGYNFPTSVLIVKVIWRNIINLLHNLIVIVIVVMIFPTDLGIFSFLSILGFVAIYLNAVWVAMLFGTLALRYRDLPMIIGNIVQTAFFMTPIFWKVDSLGPHAYLAEINPFYAFIALIRQPILGEIPDVHNYLYVLLITIVGWCLGIWCYGKTRHKITYWL